MRFHDFLVFERAALGSFESCGGGCEGIVSIGTYRGIREKF